jgi:hypothetical protein
MLRPSRRLTCFSEFIAEGLDMGCSECLATKLATMPLSEAWLTALEALSQSLRETRDARTSLARRDLVAPADINPLHYTRVF